MRSLRATWAGLAIVAMIGGCAPTPPVEELALADMVPNRDMAAPDAPLYSVYFDLGSAELTPATRAILDRLTSDPARAGWTRITLAGHADRTGPRRLNERLAAARVEAVRRYLVAAGIPESLVVDAVVGDRQAKRGVDPEERRVEIFVTG